MLPGLYYSCENLRVPQDDISSLCLDGVVLARVRIYAWEMVLLLADRTRENKICNVITVSEAKKVMVGICVQMNVEGNFIIPQINTQQQIGRHAPVMFLALGINK